MAFANEWQPKRAGASSTGEEPKAGYGWRVKSCLHKRKLVRCVFLLRKPTGFLSEANLSPCQNPEKGYKIMYTPHAKIWHKVSAAVGKDSAFKGYYDARNPMLVVLLHKSPDFFRRYFWHHVRAILWVLLIRVNHFRFYTALKTIQGLFSGIWWGIKNKKLTLRHFIDFYNKRTFV